MRDAYDELQRRGVEVGAVTFGNAEMTGRFCERQGAPFPCYADPQRVAYDAFALDRKPPWRVVLDPRQLWRIRGVPHRTELSSRQLPGAFLVDGHGEIRFAHRNRTPADNPSVEQLLAAADALA